MQCLFRSSHLEKLLKISIHVDLNRNYLVGKYCYSKSITHWLAIISGGAAARGFDEDHS